MRKVMSTSLGDQLEVAGDQVLVVDVAGAEPQRPRHPGFADLRDDAAHHRFGDVAVLLEGRHHEMHVLRPPAAVPQVGSAVRQLGVDEMAIDAGADGMRQPPQVAPDAEHADDEDDLVRAGVPDGVREQRQGDAAAAQVEGNSQQHRCRPLVPPMHRGSRIAGDGARRPLDFERCHEVSPSAGSVRNCSRVGSRPGRIGRLGDCCRRLLPFLAATECLDNEVDDIVGRSGIEDDDNRQPGAQFAEAALRTAIDEFERHLGGAVLRGAPVVVAFLLVDEAAGAIDANDPCSHRKTQRRRVYGRLVVQPDLQCLVLGKVGDDLAG